MGVNGCGEPRGQPGTGGERWTTSQADGLDVACGASAKRDFGRRRGRRRESVAQLKATKKPIVGCGKRDFG
jgi:hypothetical protein